MFVANTDHKENLLDYWEELLNPKQFTLLKKSKGYQFYEIVFQHIEEEDFRCLYSEQYSAPNGQLENEIAFNIETKLALGLKNIESIPFSMRTIYNFMNRLSSYEARTGIDLIDWY